jgi:hypothetical protein
MRPFLSRWGCAVVGAALAAYVGPAQAVPLVEMTIQVSDGFDDTFNPDGSDVGGGVFNFQGQQGNDNWLIQWDFNAVPNPIGGATIGSDYEINNFSDETLNFLILVTLPLSGPTLDPTDYAGSAGFTLSGIDGELATVGPGNSLWEAWADGSEVASLWDDPFSLSFDGEGSQAISDNIDPGVIGSTSEIGIRVNFSLTPGDSVTVTGVFGVIPAPGALALLGIAGLAGSRRRRS